MKFRFDSGYRYDMVDKEYGHETDFSVGGRKWLVYLKPCKDIADSNPITFIWKYD